MAEITSYLQTILENQKQLQEATRLNSVNIAKIHGEFTTSMGSIKALLHVLNHHIENNVFSSWSVPRHDESHHRSHPGPTRSGGDGDVSGTEGVHRECLQEHLPYIVKELMIDGTTLIDELQEDSCLTEGEVSDIRDRGDAKTRIRKLIYAIYTRDKSIFSKFMKRLQRDNNHVHDKIQQTYSTKLKDGPRASECLICVIKRDVDIRRVADKLCSHFIIDMDYLHTLQSFSDHSLPRVREEFWSYVFSQIDQSSKRAEQLLQLRDALSESKYKGLAEKLGCWTRPQMSCKCNCYPTSSFKVFNFSDSFSISTGDLSTTSNVRSKSQRSLQSVSSLEEDVSTGCMTHGGNLPYTVAWLNSSPTINTEGEPWAYPDSQRNGISDNTEKEKSSLLSLQSIANELKEEIAVSDRQAEPRRSFPSLLATEESDKIKRQRLDISTDDLDVLVKPPRLELDVQTASQLSKGLAEMMLTPLPVVDVYTGRKKVYTKKRHTRTRSDESLKIMLEHDLLRSGEQDRLRLVNGLVDTPERGISEIFYSDINNIRPKSTNENQYTAMTSGDTKVTADQSETCDLLNTDNRIPVMTPNCVKVFTQTSTDKTENGRHSEVFRTRSDGNTNPQYVTEQIIMTPSKHLDPLASGIGTRSDNTEFTRKQKRKERNMLEHQLHRLRFDTY